MTRNIEMTRDEAELLTDLLMLCDTDMALHLDARIRVSFGMATRESETRLMKSDALSVSPMSGRQSMLSWDYGDGVSGKCFWFRVFGYGLYFKRYRGDLMFSERYGYSRYLVFFGIKVRILTPR